MRIVVDGLPYPIILSMRVDEETASLAARESVRAIVISDRNVGTRGALIAQALQRSDCEVVGLHDIDAGERHKRWKLVAQLHELFLDAGVDRAGIIVAVGGGTLTDVVGFAAATYMRGVPWLPVATTLLGMVDAAIGGKTGVDLPQGKNLIGSLWQPVGVICDVAALSTLPAAHVRSGMVEIVKTAVVGDPGLLGAVERHDLGSPPEEWANLITQAAAVKVRVVASDPNEKGPRAVLNLGHTVAHAIEQASKYRIGHGAAVALGLRAEGVLARDRTGWSRVDHQRVLAALRRLGQRLRLTRLPLDAILAAMRADKKRYNGTLRFALPVRLGEVRSNMEVSEAHVREALKTLAQAPRRGGW